MTNKKYLTKLLLKHYISSFLLFIMFSNNTFSQSMNTIKFKEKGISYSVLNKEKEFQIILIHGLGDNSQSFKPLIQSLSNYKLVLVDLPGCGDNKDINLGFNDYPAFILDLIKRESKSIKRTIILAHSFGGLISLLAYQNDTKGLIDKVIAIEPSISDADKDFFKFIQEPPMGIGFEELRKNNGTEKGYLKQYKVNLQNSNAEVMKENILSVYKKFEENQNKIFSSAKPFVYCYGKNSSQPEVRAAMADYKFIKVVGFENAEHWVHQDQPEAFLEFLKTELK